MHISHKLCVTHFYHCTKYHTHPALTALIEFYSNCLICCVQTFVHQATERHILYCKRDELCWSDGIQGRWGRWSVFTQGVGSYGLVFCSRKTSGVCQCVSVLPDLLCLSLSLFYGCICGAIISSLSRTPLRPIWTHSWTPVAPVGRCPTPKRDLNRRYITWLRTTQNRSVRLILGREMSFYLLNTESACAIHVLLEFVKSKFNFRLQIAYIKKWQMVIFIKTILTKKP